MDEKTKERLMRELLKMQGELQQKIIDIEKIEIELMGCTSKDIYLSINNKQELH
jgi:hypothetical protein